MSKKIILFGEYLLRLTPPTYKKLQQSDTLEMNWAGSEANIAVSLSVFGEAVNYVTQLPANELTRAGVSKLHQYNVNTEHVIYKGDRLGVYYYESGAGTRAGRVLYDREHTAFSLVKPGDINWDEVFKDADWFHWSGITPALNEGLEKVCEEALQVAKEKGLTISADFNYRSTLWKYGKQPNEVMPQLLQYCDVLLADIDTAKLYFGIKPDENNIVAHSFELIQTALPSTKFIAMTMREQSDANNNHYSGYLFHQNKIYSSRSYRVDNVVERIGAGDAFMAGLIYALRQQQSTQQSIEFATACGAIKHFIPGDFNIATKEEVKTVIAQSGSGKIIR